MKLLLQILAAKRPYGDPYEKAFVQTVIIERLEAKGHHVIRTGPMENLVVIVPNEAGYVNKVLFSCHTDTVHHTGGPNKVIVDETMGVAYTDDKGHECLGADDGTGVWILLEMIDAKIPGTYVFHRGEERGCIGSGWMSKDEATQEFLKKYDYAIAFDRRDHTDVITHQRSRRCCSDEFAKAFAAALNAHDTTFGYKPDPTGIYTDTANYDGLIKECTNISVGYSGAHGAGEIQDLEHAQRLLEVCKKIRWEDLPAVREAKKETYGYNNGYTGGRGSQSQRDYGATGRSTSAYEPGTSSRSTGSSAPTGALQTTMKYMAQRYIETEGKNAMIDAMQRMFKDPPLSLKEMLQSSIDGKDGTEGMNDYLMALVKYMPEMAMLALRQSLVYFQYYQLMLSKEGKKDSGLLGFSPVRSKSLEEQFEAGGYGILFDKKPVVPPYRPDKVDKPDPERAKITELRKKRKELKKAKKAEKKGKIKGRQFVSGSSPGSIRELKNTKDPTDPPRTNVVPINAAGSDHFPTVKNVTQ